MKRGEYRAKEKQKVATEVAKIPHDPYNEQVVIAAACVDRKARSYLVQVATSDCFFAKGHAKFWDLLKQLEQKQLDYDLLTMQALAGDTDLDLEGYFDQLVRQRPKVPSNLAYHVQALMHDRQRIEAARGPVSALLEALKDTTTEPSALRALARNVGGSFEQGTLEYLRDSQQLVHSVISDYDKRKGGQHSWPVGLDGFDIYGPEEELAGQYRVLPGLAPKHISLVTGLPGCIYGDAKVGVNRGGNGRTYTVREIVRMFTGGVSSGKVWDASIPTMVRTRDAHGCVRLTRLIDAYESGVKTTYTVNTATLSIRATADHRFMTEHGWKRVSELTIADRVWVEAPRTKKLRKKKTQYREVCRLWHHPNATGRNNKNRSSAYKVPEHRIVYEAHMNKLDVEEFVARLRIGKIAGLRFIEAGYVVHHIDENPTNNMLSNLQLMTVEAHHRHHGREGGWQSVVFRTRLEQVEAVALYGEEPTFDLEVEDDGHAFIADGFVVHNSGKSTTVCGVLVAQANAKRRILYGAWEMTSETSLELCASVSLGLSRTDVLTASLRPEDERALKEEVERLSQYIKFFELPFGRKQGEKQLNDRNLDLIHSYVVSSGCEIFVADLWRKAIRQFDPDEEEEALNRQQAIARETNTHTMMVHQQRLKDVEQRADKRPTREGLKGSGAWTEVADLILGVHNPALFKNVPNNVLEVIILKQRYGRWPLAVEFDYDPVVGSLLNGRSVDVTQQGEENQLDAFLKDDKKKGGFGGRRKKF